MLFIFTDPSIFIAVLSLYENMKWKIFSVCLFWTQHTTRLTTALGRETGWWNKLIFVQQRTFITHSNDDIFPFSSKIESRSLSHIYVFPPPDWWRDQFKFSTFFYRVHGCLLSPSKKGSLFRKFNELNRVITIQGVRCGFYQLDIRSSVNNNARDFSCSIKTSQHIH